MIPEPDMPAAHLTKDRYDRVTIAFHWLTALLVVVLFGTAFAWNYLPREWHLRSLEEEIADFEWKVPDHQRLVSHMLEWYALSLDEDPAAELDGRALSHHLALSGLGDLADRILRDRSSGNHQRQATSDELVLEQWARLRGKRMLRARARAAFARSLEPDGDVGD